MKKRFTNILIAIAATLFIAATTVSLAPYWGAIVGAGLTTGNNTRQPVADATIGPTSQEKRVGEYDPNNKTITFINTPSTLEELKDAIDRLNSIDSRHNSKRKEINDKAVEKFSVEQSRIADEYQKALSEYTVLKNENLSYLPYHRTCAHVVLARRDTTQRAARERGIHI